MAEGIESQIRDRKTVSFISERHVAAFSGISPRVEKCVHPVAKLETDRLDRKWTEAKTANHGRPTVLGKRRMSL